MTKEAQLPDPSSHESLLAIASIGLIAEHLGQALCAKTRDGKLVLVNAAYCALVDRDRASMIGATEAEIVGPNARVAAAEEEVMESKRPMQVPQHFPIDGDQSSRLTVRIPLSDATGEITHLVCVVGDSGEEAAPEERLDEEIARYERERARALRSVQDQLLRKERLMVLGQLAAGLAHQIRNPLSAITNAIALARRQIPSNAASAHEALRIAHEEIWEANRIIADLLDYARIRPPTRHPARVSDLVSGALEGEPVPEGIEVRCVVDDTQVDVDERQVRDALRNLVRNAREAMEDSGTLSFRTQLDGDWVELWVEDTGVGVTAEHRHLLFEPLITSKPLGIGLGLPTARALIMNQGGTLDCVEGEGSGARFVLRLPVSGSAVATVPDQA